LGEGWGEGAPIEQVAQKDEKLSAVTNLTNLQANKESLTLTLSQRERGSPTAEAQLLALQEEMLETCQTFHWMLEFPEIFYASRRDPLDEGKENKAALMDAFIGNPPFGGKNAISNAAGPLYIPWLQELHEGSHGNADLSAHFFRRAATLLGDHGTMGLIATNTIAQGDTRTTGLQYLATHGYEIYDATSDMKWPVPGAAVTISIAHLVAGSPCEHVSYFLNGKSVSAVNSRLLSKPERSDPVKLKTNAGLSFQGTVVLGMGFTLTPEEREAFIEKDPKNAECIFPYLGGKEVNTSPTQTFHRYVISFGTMSLEEAGEYPDLLERIRKLVKPERERLKNNSIGNQRRANWWKFGSLASGLYDAVRPLERCLVNSQVSKHLLFAFQPVDRIFAHTLYGYAIPEYSSFATLQSRIHEPWARMQGSTMETRMRYTASSCFETFPLPQITPAFENIGKQLYEFRAKYMVDNDQGLTTTYNELKDPECQKEEIEALRKLHEEMDRAVLEAYGWSDIDVPPYGTPVSEKEKRALQDFEDEVIDRLFVLNAVRAKEEKTPSPLGRGLG